MGTATVSSLFTGLLGGNLLITRPTTLATDWQWTIRERDNPSIVKAFSPSLIPNLTRHQLHSLDDRYEVNVVYELVISNDIGAEVLSGDFTVEQADFGIEPDFTSINAKLRLALGLAGVDVRWEHITHDPATGIPLLSRFTIYTDATLATVLARGELRRRLNDNSMVAGEIQNVTFYDPDALFPETGTGTE